METSDVIVPDDDADAAVDDGLNDVAIPRNAAATGPSTRAEQRTRYTAQIFDTDPFACPFVSSGAPVRLPTDKHNWPPTILFDAVYAAAVLTHFSTSKDDDRTAWSRWTAKLYPERVSRAQANVINTPEEERADTTR